MVAAGAQTRVVIVDPHVMFAECLEVALNLRGYETRVIVPPGGRAGPSLVRTVLRARPTVAIVNLDLTFGNDGADLSGPLVASDVAVVVVTEESDRSRWGECLVRGARTVISQDAPLTAVTSAIRRIREGSPVMPRDEILALVRSYQEADRARQETRARLDRLTGREAEILGHLMAGRTVSDIARAGFVSEATVRTQVRSVLAKLGVSSQLAAVGRAHNAKWRFDEGLEPAAGPR
jgi:two-component system, NarL family, nitrate/nitrite response regulator NarL